MTTELDRLAKKNTEQKLDAVSKKQQIKKHNIKAALKNERKNRDDATFLGSDYKKSTPKSDSLNKARRKVEKSEKWFDKQANKLEKHGVKGSALAQAEKRDIIKKGFPSKAKMDIDVHRPNFPAKKLKAGGIALRGLGRAFLKGGKV